MTSPYCDPSIGFRRDELYHETPTELMKRGTCSDPTWIWLSCLHLCDRILCSACWLLLHVIFSVATLRRILRWCWLPRFEKWLLSQARSQCTRHIRMATSWSLGCWGGLMCYHLSHNNVSRKERWSLRDQAIDDTVRRIEGWHRDLDCLTSQQPGTTVLGVTFPWLNFLNCMSNCNVQII